MLEWSLTSEMVKAEAHTGAPAKASTAFTPQVRRKVLLPDMFDPVTMMAFSAPSVAKLLLIRLFAGISGWPISSALKTK